MTIILAAIAGAAIYRARGMGLWRLPRPFWQSLFALGYASMSYQPQVGGIVIGALIAGGVLVLTTAAVTTGHASYIDLGSVADGAANAPADGQVDEWYGGWIPGAGYWHDFAGLVVSGLLISAPAGLALLLGGEWRGLAVIASGALKPFAYAAAKFVPQRWVADRRRIDEPLAGGLLWGSLAAILLA